MTTNPVRLMAECFLNKYVELHCGDCRDVLARLPDASIDSCVTDPPYSLVSIVKRFGKEGSAPVRVSEFYQENGESKGSSPYLRASAGFMGKAWDTGEVAFDPVFWAQVYRVLKPGGHVLAMGSTRTYHRLACAIEDAWFEIRDTILYIYGSGFPKSHSMRDIGRPELGTALKPACEPIALARKPLSEGTVAANVLKHGTGAINVDGCRVGTNGGTKGCDAGPSTGIYGDGLNGTFGKPVEGLGRWPANVIHDGSAEVVAAFPETESGSRNGEYANGTFSSGTVTRELVGDSGSAARFFYTAKADSDERIGSKHPTVKPLDLMQYLVRLITPKNGTCLDPFAGTGTTGEAAWREGCRAVLVEAESEYQADIRRRMALALAGPDERGRESLKANGKAQGHDDLPLFALKSEWEKMWSKPFGLTDSERREAAE